MAAAEGLMGTTRGNAASQTLAIGRWSDMMEDDDDSEIKQISAGIGSLGTASSCGSPRSGSTTASASQSCCSPTPRGSPISEVGSEGGFCLNPNSPAFTPMAGLSHGCCDTDQSNLMWQLACRAMLAEAACPHMEPVGRRPNSVKPQTAISKSLEKVTLQFRGAPPDLTRESLILDMSKFCEERYTFVYVPKDFATGKAVGGAFVCFVSQPDAEVAKSYFEENGVVGKSVEVSLLAPEHHQQWLITRYRNSPVMHPDVRPEYKPLIFANGQRVEFPAPTREIRKI